MRRVVSLVVMAPVMLWAFLDPPAGRASAAPSHGPSGSPGDTLADFNADGFADLAIGVPFEDDGDRLGTGWCT